MNLGKNIQFLRKQQKITQEQLAERMLVSRQTISKWESDEVVPELNKLIDLSDMFHCKLDAMIRETLTAHKEIYSEVTIKTIKSFRMGRYVMITPQPENDVNVYMENWAVKSGLLDVKPDAKRIGWDFPFVSMEQQNRFGLRGYAAAYVLPEEFEPACPGVEIANQTEADYAVLTIYEPFVEAFERIPNGYKCIMEYLKVNGFKEKAREDVLPCFEYVYNQDGMTRMDVHIHAEGVSKTEVFTSFS